MRKTLAALALAGGITLAAAPLAFADTTVDVDASHAAEHVADHALQHADVATHVLDHADVLNDLGGVLNYLNS